MLSAPHRMRRSADFGAAVRGGRRAGSSTVVVHVLRDDDDHPPLVGFVVSKAVGRAVVRNRIKRRLRALMRPMVTSVPAGTRVVVRANQAAAAASSGTLGRDLRSALRRAGALVVGTEAAGGDRTGVVQTEFRGEGRE
ncbi:MAG: ribonuclease P protein component [Kineosporiaceae bacterium]